MDSPSKEALHWQQHSDWRHDFYETIIYTITLSVSLVRELSCPSYPSHNKRDVSPQQEL